MILKHLKFEPHHSRYSSGHPFQLFLLSITKIEFQEMKTTMSKLKITLDGINNKLDIIFQN